MYYPSNHHNQPSLHRLWQGFKTRAMYKAAVDTPPGPQPVNPLPAYQVEAATPAEASNAHNSALRLALAALLGGAAVGGTVTGISGLHKLLSEPEVKTPPQELEMEMPVPVKRASDPIDVGSGRWWNNEHARGSGDVWWTIPAVAGGAIGGTLGMSALMEHLIKKKRKAEMDTQLQTAKSDFQNSLMGQYKQSSADPLDSLFDIIEKRASLHDANGLLSSDWKEYAPLLAGGGITAGGILAAIAARGAYKTEEGRTNEDLLQKALKQRAYLQSLRSPPPVVFTPQQVSEDQK